ncbi:hypothetical protein [Microbaculum marinum]|uniref:Uncharacterized protein n=1 Tax=Microbaculum marinum TaxID=1764581 RepID=A0AAW9RUW9_9HYPH
MSSQSSGRARRLAGYAIACCLAVASLTGPSPASAEGFGFATFTATVTGNGTTTRGSGVKKSTRAGTGEYIVTFMRSVKACTPFATVRGTAAGQISVAPVADNGKQVAVTTFNKSGVKADRSFSLLASCV